jgi:hypothetical protein
MKSKHLFFLGMSLLFAHGALAQSTTFTYQGRLNWNGQAASGLYDFLFSVMDAEVGGVIINGSVATNGVGVTNGLFTVLINPGVGVFTGPPRWLDILVRTNGGSSFTPLSPRQLITSTPYAIRAGDAATAASVGAGAVGTSALQTGAVDSARIADGTITLADLSGPLGTNTFWRLNGNGGTSPGANFVGTMDNQPLELRVNNTRALRLEPNATSPNVVGGFSGNIVSNGNAGAVIAGGGFGPTNMNRVAGSHSTVGGGYNNEARLGSATVGGGDNNFAGNDRATVGGGFKNRATGLLSTVGGGDSNEAIGQGATVPGGRLNVAGGNFSLAAGQNAKATNSSTFVWADGSAGNFGSTANNQFLIRAAGGVGIGLNNPAAALDVNGRIKAAEFQLGTSATAGSILTANGSGVGTWQAASFVSKSGDILNGDLTIANPFDLNFGSTTRQMINLWNLSYGIGVQNNTLYQRSDGGFAWFQKGVHDNNGNNPGAGGTNLMWLDSIGNLFANASVSVDAPNANAGDIYPGLVFGSSSGEGISSKRTPGGNRYGLDFYTGFQSRLSIASSGNVGINTTSPGGLLDIDTGNGNLQVVSDLTPAINLSGGSNPGILRLRNALEVFPSFDGTRVGKIDVRDTNGTPTITLSGTGVATVKVLEITGGADIAEPFQMSHTEELPKGAVVVIDEGNPGHLKLSSEPYDTRVAGIISGANGVHPGLSLHQQGEIEGGQNVALTGRVYALADATPDAIKPGDLLTTSSTPGHVMRASDSDRRSGAVLGKAMTSLKDGKGLVLVLVSLQ